METKAGARSKVREVRKRDSRIVPFDQAKIADAIYAAFRAVGEGDRALAEELASAVHHFLEEKFAGSIPGIEDIQDLVETVLIQMGHAKVAKEYILYRQKRARMRETLQVRKVEGHQGEGITYDFGAQEGVAAGIDSPLPEVDLGQDGVSSWQKSKIAAALIREADLDPTLAEEIASSVERKVLQSGIRRLSTSFIRELVDNELFERGFNAKLKKQAPLGIPKYNLESLIFGTDVKEGFAFPKTPTEVRNNIANRILHQYSLEEVFTPIVADAHREGRIFIHRLSDPTRLSSLYWQLPPPSAATAAEEPRAAGLSPGFYLDLRDFFRRIWHLAHFFSEEIRLANLPNLLLDPTLRGMGPVEKIRTILDRLSQMEERPRLALELELGPESVPWIEGILAHSQAHPRRFLLVFRLKHGLSTSQTQLLLEAVARLYERGEHVEFLPGGDLRLDERRPAAREGAGVARFEVCGARITVNLPRASYRSARERGRSLAIEVEEALALAVKGHLERKNFIQKLGQSREGPLWGLLGEPSELGPRAVETVGFSVGILGLNECVKFLSGSDMHVDSAYEKSASKFGLELVKELDRRLRREEKSLGLRLGLEETSNVGPLRLLERSDRAKFPQLIAEVERGRQLQWGAVYTDGVRFHRMAPIDPLRRVEVLAQFLRHVKPAGGIIEDFAELRSSSRDLLVSLLEECLPVIAV